MYAYGIKIRWEKITVQAERALLLVPVCSECDRRQWRESVVNNGGEGSGSVRSSHQTVSGASKN